MRTAAAKGLNFRTILYKHGLKNALIPVVTVVALSLPSLLAGAIITETIFAWPGMGKLAADAIATRDYPVVTAVALLASVLVVTGSLLADTVYAAVDPRARHESHS